MCFFTYESSTFQLDKIWFFPLLISNRSVHLRYDRRSLFSSPTSSVLLFFSFVEILICYPLYLCSFQGRCFRFPATQWWISSTSFVLSSSNLTPDNNFRSFLKMIKNNRGTFLVKGYVFVFLFLHIKPFIIGALKFEYVFLMLKLVKTTSYFNYMFQTNMCILGVRWNVSMKTIGGFLRF